jgi:hypothetical protein
MGVNETAPPASSSDTVIYMKAEPSLNLSVCGPGSTERS